jgi:putative transposase
MSYPVTLSSNVNEDVYQAAALVQRTCAAEGIHPDGLVLHSDNGGPMKGSTMLATLRHLGIVASFSRPSVSDDNPFIESLFRTLKYRPEYPHKSFETIEQRGSPPSSTGTTASIATATSRFVTPDERRDATPLVFDKAYRATLAFFELQTGLRQSERSRVRTTTGEPTSATLTSCVRPSSCHSRWMF